MVPNMACSSSMTHDVLLWQHATNALTHYSGFEFKLFRLGQYKHYLCGHSYARLLVNMCIYLQWLYTSEWNFQDRGSPHPYLSAFRDDSRSFEGACASDCEHHLDGVFLQPHLHCSCRCLSSLLQQFSQMLRNAFTYKININAKMCFCGWLNYQDQGVFFRTQFWQKVDCFRSKEMQ